jgi:cytochrome c biogenesis protein CcdA
MDDSAGLFLCFFLLGIPIYFLPTIIASLRNHKNLAALFALNVFLGWVVVGWVVALVWALLADQGGPGPSRRRKKRFDGPSPFDDPPAAEEPAPVPIPVPVAATASATVAYSCPRCRVTVHVPTHMVGAVVGCRTCGGTFTATPPAY